MMLHAARPLPIEVRDAFLQDVANQLQSYNGDLGPGTEPAMGGKLLELLKEIALSVKRVAILFNPETAPYVAKYLSGINAVSASIAVDAIAIPIKDATDIEHAIESFALEPNGGLLFPGDITTIVHSELIVALGAKNARRIYPPPFCMTTQAPPKRGAFSSTHSNVEARKSFPLAGLV